MNKAQRFGILGSAVAIGMMGYWGVAWGADQHHARDKCIQNDHSSTDLAVHPECKGDRDVRDNDPEGQSAKPLFGQGLFPHGGS
jgi:hypothetical protein